jgi:hypothetical protein
MSQNNNTSAARRGAYTGGRGGNHPTGRYPTRSQGRLQTNGQPMPKKTQKHGPESVKWGESTFMVPQKISMGSTQNEKHQFLEQTARALHDHKSASWTDKVAWFPNGLITKVRTEEPF